MSVVYEGGIPKDKSPTKIDQSMNISRLQNLTSEIASNLSSAPETSNKGASNLKPNIKSMHYEVPSLCSMLYEYTNKEQDNILNAFRIGNWNHIRDLPNNIAPNNVLQQLQIKMNITNTESSVISQNNKKHREQLE